MLLGLNTTGWMRSQEAWRDSSMDVMEPLSFTLGISARAMMLRRNSCPSAADEQCVFEDVPESLVFCLLWAAKDPIKNWKSTGNEALWSTFTQELTLIVEDYRANPVNIPQSPPRSLSCACLVVAPRPQCQSRTGLLFLRRLLRFSTYFSLMYWDSYLSPHSAGDTTSETRNTAVESKHSVKKRCPVYSPSGRRPLWLEWPQQT